SPSDLPALQATPLLAPCELARRRLRRLYGLRPALAGAATPASLRPCPASNPAACRAQVSLHLYPMKLRYKNPGILHKLRMTELAFAEVRQSTLNTTLVV